MRLAIGLLLTIAPLGLATVAAPARAAGFDCAKAEKRVEKLICANPDLSALDDQLNAAYRAAAGAAASPALRHAQNAWRRTRDQCGDAPCVKAAYDQRIASLGGAEAAQSSSTQASSGMQGKFCIFGTGNAYSMLLVRPAGTAKLQFALTDWTPNGANFSVAGIASGGSGSYRFEDGMSSPDRAQRCTIRFAPLGGGGYSVTLQSNAKCEAMGGKESVQYLADRYPTTARMGDAPAIPDMDALNHTVCDRNGH